MDNDTEFYTECTSIQTNGFGHGWQKSKSIRIMKVLQPIKK
jgi:hypothetical protein